MIAHLQTLQQQLQGELYYDTTMRTLYATDASAYREMPLAVALPKTESDIKLLIAFALQHKTSLIPRTAGTSLAGQVVGNGIVVDVSKYFNEILELNVNEKWVRVQPGVIRDDLNVFLKPYGLLFGPETSTANRAMIGGMVGNNSCGSNSVVYKSTREHIIEIKAILSDGSDVVFGETDLDTFHAKCEMDTLEGRIYNNIRQLLSNYDNRVEIAKQFPKKSIERRNTGYAIDLLMQTAPFEAGGPNFNFCTLIAGSEGTLAFITEIKLNVVPLPPKETGLLCVHFNTIHESLLANLIALQFAPTASELIDHYILECTKGNIEQQKNRFFVKGDPGAILVVEFKKNTREKITRIAEQVEAAMREKGLGYHFPLLFGDDTKKIWNLRKAGLGLLGNMPGDDKAVPVIEDTAVDVNDLPDYIADFNKILEKYGLYSVHYAHAGSGELHLRPIINLKTAEGNALFRTIATEVAALVKQYNGSLSGEHGDGRLRGEFIPKMIGAKNYALLKQIKETWDPHHIFNPGKIVDTPPMNTFLRYTPGQKDPNVITVFRWGNQTVLQHAEQCNGSGDCRKTHLSGGTMCPSFMATRNEKDTTRARANILREFLTHSIAINKFNHKEIYEVMDLCLSCKGCKSECPSNVDVAKLKAEFLQQYYNANGIPFRSKLIANFSAVAKIGSVWPGLYNGLVTNRISGSLIKKIAGFAVKRSMPTLSKITVREWMRKRKEPASNNGAKRKVYFFCDEFTNYNDAGIGITAIQLLEKLGYEVVIPHHVESGRAMLSKGLLLKAKAIAHQNIDWLSDIVSEEAPLIGIEPSAILTFRDEYIDLADDDHYEKAKQLAKNVFYIDEFLACEIEKGFISAALFTDTDKKIVLHGHCQQKALTNLNDTVKVLSLPQNYTVNTLPSGCCGMAGSFGYEREHYDLSMQIGNLVLFPAVNKADATTIIAAPGTSCRHQIKDGTGKQAKHTVEVLWEALL
ncbi:FAD-binding and (Fe-S)-binding domain-containing protein [Hydrotalea sandarakina]|jgi:FAD/FMN-containing dehydrogenase/Fe-S oxidoreductase|uniref:FAD/FMN-containing dehydrogenase n=1 Tax=Hydrotalea sandarakina TaxID=1004304 RepID=A0A2W7S7B4_9BACT|nr:FAD-binding and (Fe-S)-binding domain-containing protein [Hydrotalea sandarakina]PZX62849.1 FAD/FMN-containing dehydrogenase [Hydrotalea sandarakina]